MLEGLVLSVDTGVEHGNNHAFSLIAATGTVENTGRFIHIYKVFGHVDRRFGVKLGHDDVFDVVVRFYF